MFLHEIPAIAAGLDHLGAQTALFRNVDRSQFPWLKRDPGFAGLIWLILGQQVSTQAAAAMWRKLETAMGPVDPAPFLKLDDPVLTACGFSRQKMRYARTLAETLIGDPDFLVRLTAQDDASVIGALTALPGIGTWSAEIYMMFCLGRPDVWPAGDLGIVLGMQSLLGLPERPKPAALIAPAEPWRPYRTAAALLVWDHYCRTAPSRRREHGQRRRVRSVSVPIGKELSDEE